MSATFRRPDLRALAGIINAETEGGIYAAYNLHPNTVKAIVEWANTNGLQDKMVPPEEFHLTTVYSREPFPYRPAKKENFQVKFKEFKILGDKGGTLVLVVDSQYLHNLFDHRRSLGASWDFPSYIPHITVAKNVDEADLDALSIPNIKFILTDEYKDKLDDDFSYDTVKTKEDMKSEAMVLAAVSAEYQPQRKLQRNPIHQVRARMRSYLMRHHSTRR